MFLPNPFNLEQIHLGLVDEKLHLRLADEQLHCGVYIELM